MIVYNPNDGGHGAALLGWYTLLHETDEMSLLFTKEAHTVQGFLRLFDGPCCLAFEADACGIWFASFIQPAFGGAAFFSVWTRQDKRGTKSNLQAFYQCYDAAFKRWPVLLGLTKQVELIPVHIKMGYTVIGILPKVWDGENVYLMALTKEGYTHGLGGRKSHGRYRSSVELQEG